MLVARVEILSHGMLNSSQLINATHFLSSEDKIGTPHMGYYPKAIIGEYFVLRAPGYVP